MSDPGETVKALDDMFLKFAQRGYPIRELEAAKSKFLKLTRTQTLSTKTKAKERKILPWVNLYTTASEYRRGTREDASPVAMVTLLFLTSPSNAEVSRAGWRAATPRGHVSMFVHLRLLADLFSNRRTISAAHCTIQLYVILFLGGTECQLLVLMAYDRYVAICRPLHYPVLMRWSVCYRLAAFVWIFSFMINIVPCLSVPLPLCNRNQINHFMCELLAVLKLSCDNIDFSENGIFSLSFISLLFPFMCIMISYVRIIASVLKIRSAGRSKAFSTCSSHILVVALFFGAGMFTYFGPSSQYSSNQDKYVSIFYVIICPMLNPLIYSINNREVRNSFKKCFQNVLLPPQ
ncbi:olfactory receptor 2B6-like [Pseudophryne corroboree]|uniref:olfactory receptor 2B6-like n=1 Tax=Pseudophryne corroboree TaxID=495146 RepID=UPI0030814D1E